jgi:hypothetical protein
MIVPDVSRDITSMGRGQGVAFLVGAMTVSGAIAAACSSPQTAEINANKRAETLMKWVHVGVVESILLIALAAAIDPEHRNGIAWGGGITLLFMYGCYVHAKKAGLANNAPGTES